MMAQASYILDIIEIPEVKLTSKQLPILEPEAALSSADVETMEERMRRALGLCGPGARPTLTTKAAPARQGGDGSAAPGLARRKPDSISGSSALPNALSPLQQRVAALEQKLATEQQRHGQVRQLLQQTELAARTLQARCEHTALAQQEELDRERQATLTAQHGLDNAPFELRQRTTAKRSANARSKEEASQAAANQAPVGLAAAKLDIISSSEPVNDPSLPKKRGRPRTRPLPEPKPVRWWTPSFRTKPKG